MEDAYFELKAVPEMKGTINSVISSNRKLYRPPSLSESFAWTPENVLRATEPNRLSADLVIASFSRSEKEGASNTSLDLLVAPSPQVSPPPPQEEAHKTSVCNSGRLVNNGLRFLFHITLLSIFESVFFFLYISKLEDNGINSTVGSFIKDAVDSCSNFTVPERAITNHVLMLFLNGTQIIVAGNAAEQSRAGTNSVLLTRAWIYVGALSGLFTIAVGVAKLRKIKIKWTKLLVENAILIGLLAAYEYTFFSTVIFPYNPITGPEIARNAVFELQDQCGLLTT
jgi:hypothetical protein